MGMPGTEGAGTLHSSWRPRTFVMETEALGVAALCQRPASGCPPPEASEFLASGRGSGPQAAPGLRAQPLRGPRSPCRMSSVSMTNLVSPCRGRRARGVGLTGGLGRRASAWGPGHLHAIRHGDRGPRRGCARSPGAAWGPEPLPEARKSLASGGGQQLAGSEARELLSRVVLPSELSATGLGRIPKKKKPAEKKKKERKEEK